MRSHVYQVLADENGVTLNWANVQVMQADGLTPYAGVLYQAEQGTKILENPFVAAPGFVNFYLDRSTVIRLKVTIPNGGPARVGSPIYTTLSPANMVISPAVPMSMPINPYGVSVLRYERGNTEWFQPSVGPHDHHGRAPGTTVVSTKSNMRSWATSFPDATFLGTHDRAQPQYRFTWGSLYAYAKTWGGLIGATWGRWTAGFVPSPARNYQAITNVGFNALASGEGATAVGALGVASDNSIVNGTRGAVSYGARTTAQAGSVSVGWRTGTPLDEELSFEDQARISVGHRARAHGPRAIAFGASSDAASDAVALGFGTSSVQGSVALGEVHSTPREVRLPQGAVNINGSLNAQSDTSLQKVTFFGQHFPIQGMPTWNRREPASGNEALDNVIYALRDQGLLSPPVDQRQAMVPMRWYSDAVDALTTLVQSASGVSVSLNSYAGSGFVNGSVQFNRNIGSLPRVLTTAEGLYSQAVPKVSGTWEGVNVAKISQLRIAVHATKTLNEPLTAANQLGASVPLLANGTWSTPRTAPAKTYKRVRLVNLQGVTQTAVTIHSQTSLDAQVVYLRSGTVVSTAPISVDNTFFLAMDELQSYEIQVRAISSGNLIGSSSDSRLPLKNSVEMGITALSFALRTDMRFLAREILMQFRALRDSASPIATQSTLIGLACLGAAIQAFRATTGSSEFNELAVWIQNLMLNNKAKSNTIQLPQEPAADTVGNVLSVWFLHGQGLHQDAVNLTLSLIDWHVTKQGWFRDSYSPNAAPTQGMNATAFGCFLLYKVGRPQSALKAARSSSLYRVVSQTLPQRSSVTGYSEDLISREGSFYARGSIYGLLMNMLLGYGTADDVASLDLWRSVGAGYQMKADDTESSCEVMALYALAPVYKYVFYDLPPVSFSYPGTQVFPGVNKYPLRIG